MNNNNKPISMKYQVTIKNSYYKFLWYQRVLSLLLSVVSEKPKPKIKSGNSAMILEVGESMMIITNEKDETTLLPQWTNHISIFHKGTNL